MSAKNHRIVSSGERQQGAALIVSLLFLLILTLIGVAGMQVTTLEEKMSSNMRDRNLAFQAAESALRAAEAALTGATLPSFNCTGGRYKLDDINCDGTTERNIWNSVSWGTGSTAVQFYTGGTLANVSSSPAFIIEEYPPMASGTSSGSLEAGVPSGSGTPDTYRITARATGGTTAAVVILQSNFKR